MGIAGVTPVAAGRGLCGGRRPQRVQCGKDMIAASFQLAPRTADASCRNGFRGAVAQQVVDMMI
jgi:hypothetical protein